MLELFITLMCQTDLGSDTKSKQHQHLLVSAAQPEANLSDQLMMIIRSCVLISFGGKKN